MKRTNKNRQAEYLQTGKSERTAVRAAKCVTDYGQENTDVDFRKDKGRDKPLSTFLQASEIKTRQCIYISREIHEKVAIVTSRMGNGLSIGKFVDNILRDHFRQYGQQYMEEYRKRPKSKIMTKAFLIVSVGCNVWFLFLLLYERIMDTRIVRFFKDILPDYGGHWTGMRQTHSGSTRKSLRNRRTSSARAVSGWHRPGQPLPYRRKKPPLRKKALSCRRKRLLLTTETRKRIPPGTSPGGKTR